MFSLHFNDNFHFYIILDFTITYNNAPVRCQSDCACLHHTVNIIVFFTKNNENTQKGEHSYKCTNVTLKQTEGIYEYSHLASTQLCEINMCL